MADRPMTDMDEGSKGGRRSVLVFGLVAATLTVLLILVGVAGKNVGPYTGVEHRVAGNERFAEPVKIINLPSAHIAERSL
jgi:hypothetical protein